MVDAGALIGAGLRIYLPLGRFGRHSYPSPFSKQRGAFRLRQRSLDQRSSGAPTRGRVIDGQTETLPEYRRSSSDETSPCSACRSHRVGGREFDGHRPGPRKNRAARRQAVGATTESLASSASHAAGRQTGRPCAGKASCRCPAQPPATAGGRSGCRAQARSARAGRGPHEPPAGRRTSARRRRCCSAARRAAKPVGPKQVEKGQRRPDVTAKGEPRATPPARIYPTDQ
jgi:hypothetical protein